jgi:hypothetical protein
MIFKEKYKIIYCKDDYYSEFDNEDFYYTNIGAYYKGYLIHKKDGPAINYINLKKEWWLDGKRHREDGPAKEYINGSEEWWLNSKRHRKDGPAIKYKDGSEEWWLNGKRHREDGPAIKWSSGKKHWFLNGYGYSEEEYLNIKNLKNKNKVLYEI